MKNKTAVEWLRSKMLIECLEPSDELFEQALAMEKEQMHSEYMRGWKDGLTKHETFKSE